MEPQDDALRWLMFIPASFWLLFHPTEVIVDIQKLSMERYGLPTIVVSHYYDFDRGETWSIHCW